MFWKLLTVLMVCVAISFCPLKVHWSKSKWIPHDAISVQSYLIESSIWLCWKKNSCNVGMVFCFEKCLNYWEKNSNETVCCRFRKWKIKEQKMIKFTDINSRKTILNGQDKKIDYKIFFIYLSVFFPWEKKIWQVPREKIFYGCVHH